jgi:hypothetical protein
LGHATIIGPLKKIAAVEQFQGHAGMTNAVGENKVAEGKGGCQCLGAFRRVRYGHTDSPGTAAKRRPALLLVTIQDLGRVAGHDKGSILWRLTIAVRSTMMIKLAMSDRCACPKALLKALA